MPCACTCNTKGLALGGGFLAAAGLTLFILSLAMFPDNIRNLSVYEIAKNVIVTSNSSIFYDRWAGQLCRDNVYTQYYYAYNMTNADEVLKGGVPNYKQVGPFIYRFYYDYENVTFSEDQNEVTYGVLKRYFFNDSLSAYPEDSMITNINPAFLGVMAGAPDSSIFTMAATLPATNSFMVYFNSPDFFNFTMGFNGIESFNTQLNVLLTESGINMTTYLTSWANATADPTPGNWNGMLTSLDGTPSDISMSAAEIIFNASSPLSLLNSKQGMITWYNAANGEKTSINAILIGTGITQTQLQIVTEWWYYTFAMVYTQPQLLTKCGITDPSMIGFCQLHNATALNYNSVSKYHIVNNMFPPFDDTAPEIVGLVNATIQEFYTMFYESGNNSLSTINGASEFLNYGFGRSPNLWNISDDDANAIGDYFAEVGSFVHDQLQEIFLNNGGLLATKKVSDWLWNCNDPLLNFISNDSPCGLQFNNSINLPTTVYTGKKDNTLNNFILKWQEQADLQYWANPVPVNAYSENGQFATNEGDTILQNYTIMEENIYRPITMVYTNETEYAGIKTHRYYLMNDSFAANPTYYTKVDGFTNLTWLQNDVPTFVSRWDMYEVPISVSSRVIGQNPSYEEAAFPIDVEPRSGNSLFYNIKLQINFLFPNGSNKWDTTFNMYNDIKTDVYMPSFKVGLSAQASDYTVNNLKSQFKQLHVLKVVPVVVCALLGSLMFVGGCVMAAIGTIRWRRKDYRLINDY
ncbi:hypothetical protein SAMD00019534_001780 [Acytostelium subglobosum LB1]|uniref:hypothetical protein n=1 Tax=Acytostelium subglobosum LB1 TaxID=1410327 RepID=UPI0006450FB3|nr:hypothetical protein SAMD00019534_001780 [Acytostelium subglobosum LB1]GAM17003.1 hypothetical protein SAMD00019534_001780 [Acytostelium subglobosum LB1]|eukprot:XP_012759065.1 hypothetical protein SAMD00019534_001780 [Acytostelium subglobosum LB1]